MKHGHPTNRCISKHASLLTRPSTHFSIVLYPFKSIKYIFFRRNKLRKCYEIRLSHRSINSLLDSRKHTVKMNYLFRSTIIIQPVNNIFY